MASDFLTFAGDPAADVMTQAEYADVAFTARLLGFSTGTALSVQLNKVWRQASVMSSMLGTFIDTETGLGARDDATPAGMNKLLTDFTLAVHNVAVGAIGVGYLKLTGGTLTGSLTINAPDLAINSAGADNYLSLNRHAGFNSVILGETNGSARWMTLFPNSAAETGNNQGSNYVINRFGDSGQYLGTPLQISRATGVVDFSAPPTVGGGLMPYVPIAGGVMTGTLGVGGFGVAFPGLGSYWGQHHVAFGWDGTWMEMAVDGSGVGQIATINWVTGVLNGDIANIQGELAGYLKLTGGTLSGGLVINAGLTVAGGGWFDTTVYFCNLGDFYNSYDGSRYRYRQFAGSWFEQWDGKTGNRTWWQNGYYMSLDGGANLFTSGYLHCWGGRILCESGAFEPTVCAWNAAAGVATGFSTDGSGMWFCGMDGSGNISSRHMLIDNSGNVTAWQQLDIGGNINGHSSINASLDLTAGRNASVAQTLWVNLDLSVARNAYVGYLSSAANIDAAGDIRAYGGHMISLGYGYASVTVLDRNANWAIGMFIGGSQINFGPMDGNGNSIANAWWACNSSAFAINSNIKLYYNPYAASDAALKANIALAPEFDSLGAIIRTAIKSFDWRHDNSHVAHGVIAQDLEETLPDVVTVCPIEPNKGLKYIDTQAVMAHVFRAIQQLAEKIDARK